MERLVIRSYLDGEYLYPSDSGKVCDSLSPLHTMEKTDSNPFPEEYKWRVVTDTINYKYQLLNEGPGQGHQINQLTYGDYPPFCFLVYRNLDLVPITNSTAYKIINDQDGKCLTNFGSDRIMYWVECVTAGDSISWDFQETTPTKSA